jgi:hypothetical protein
METESEAEQTMTEPTRQLTQADALRGAVSQIRQVFQPGKPNITDVELTEIIRQAAAPPATGEGWMLQAKEALQVAAEWLKHAPHTRVGVGGVTEHNPKFCGKCKVDAALAALPDPSKEGKP